MPNPSFHINDANKSHDDLLLRRRSLDSNGGTELTYSYLDITGCEDLQDYDERCEIAHDIQVEIQKYFYNHHIEDVIYNITVDDDVCTLYIKGPDTMDTHVEEIEAMVKYMYFDKMETFFTRFYAYLRKFIFF